MPAFSARHLLRSLQAATVIFLRQSIDISRCFGYTENDKALACYQNTKGVVSIA